MIEFEERFATNQDCIDYLTKIRWPDGFRCPNGCLEEAWKNNREVFECKECGRQTSITAGTIFHKTHKPLTLWFRAMWHITSQKYGTNALGLQRALGFGSYNTAWQWLHKLRRAMVRPDRDRLTGVVEIDEAYLGGKRAGKRGRGAEGKALVAVAVEDRGTNGIGRIRLKHIEDASADSLEEFIKEVVERGATIRTDDWSGYNSIRAFGYDYIVTPSSEMVLAHRIISLMKRWILGTYQGAVRPTHLSYYLDEYTFRFNRRTSRSRGKLFYRLAQQAMQVDPAPLETLKGDAAGKTKEINKNLDHNIWG